LAANGVGVEEHLATATGQLGNRRAAHTLISSRIKTSHTPAVARQRGQGYFGTQVCRDTFGLQDDVLPLAVVDSRLVADVQDAVARQRIMLKSRPATYMA